jgi:hypothetical protein
VTRKIYVNDQYNILRRFCLCNSSIEMLKKKREKYTEKLFIPAGSFLEVKYISCLPR